MSDTVYAAADGQKAPELVVRERVDLVLSDINMANTAGISFLREKAARDNITDIPVLVISTETGDITGEAESPGAVGALEKPFSAGPVNKVLDPLL